jgi:hypothetical protein
VRIEYTVNLDDIVEFTRFHYQTTTCSPKATIKDGATFFIVLLLMVSVTGKLNVGSFVIVAAATIAWTVLCRPLALWYMRRKARSLYARGKNKRLIGCHSLEIADGLLRQRNEGGSDDVRFEVIERVAEDPSYVFIYVSAMTAYVVPRRGVTNGDLASFVAELRSRIAAAVEPAVAPDGRVAGTS